MIRFISPEWLVLAPVLILAGWLWPAIGLRQPLRAVCAALLLLAVSGPEWRRQDRGLDLWVLTDRSASCADLIEPRIQEMQTLLERSKSSDDRIHWIDYASIPQPREAQDPRSFTGSRDRTRTATAIHYVLSRIERGRASRVLVMTDGNSSEPLADATARLCDQSIPLDYRLFSHAGSTDYRVADLVLPARIQAGEPFLVEIRVEGEPDADVPFTLKRDRALVASGTIKLRDGRGELRYTDELEGAGAHRYEVLLTPAQDAFPGNNRTERWIESTGRPRIVLLTSYANDPLATTLRGQGCDIQTITETMTADPGLLSGARAVILNNVPAYRLDGEFIKALDFYVRQQGGGLIMVGGKYSFGAGGYFESPVDPLLPVSMELKQEHRKLSAAIAIVLDRSGSMSCGVPGQPGVAKIDLADDGAARSVELLGAMDAVTVIPVDSEAHVMVPLTTLGTDRSAVIGAIRRIQSTGGGIFVYTGLKAAWEQIRKAPQGQRHIILFADAADAEEPGDFRTLVPQIVKEGGSVSVIGMGSEKDCDANFLKEVASLGNGRIFFAEDVSTLPAMFAQETVAISRSAFLDEAVGLTPTPGWMELAARPLDWLAAVDGYNLSYLRDGAATAAISGDEYKAPLIAFWQRGMGRVTAISFPLGGPFSESVRTWPGYADMVRTIVRWNMSRETPPGAALRVRRDGEMLTVDLLYDERWEPVMARHAPELVTSAGGADLEHHAWRRMAPGRHTAQIPLDPSVWLRGAVQLGEHTMPFGPINAGSDLEWRFDRARVEELRQASARSGGTERLDLPSIWNSPRLKTFTPLRAHLLVTLLVLFLIEALVTRAGWTMPTLRRAGAPKAAKRPRTRTVKELLRPVEPPPPAPPKPEPPKPPPPKTATDARRDLFNRAKRRQ